MTAVSPQWATWSIQSIKMDSCSILDETKPAIGPRGDVQTSQSIEKGRLALFAQTFKEDIPESKWQDFDGYDYDDLKVIKEMQTQTGPDLKDDRTNDDKEVKINVDVLFEQVKTYTKEKPDSTNVNENTVTYRYDPLTTIEAQSLLRALKLSNYIPPSAQELEEEKRMISTARIEPGQPPKDDKPADKRRRGNRINEETGKRIYKIGTRATGLNQRENKEAREVLSEMCKQMLPRRNFDWIIATLTYNRSDMLGFTEEIPSSKILVREKVMKSIKEEKMPVEHLAYVVALLAEASKVDTSIYDIIDPTKKARTRGKVLAHVRDQMTAQSKAIFDVLQRDLFPDLFRSIAPMEGKGKAIAEEKNASDDFQNVAKAKEETTENKKERKEEEMDKAVKEEKQAQKSDWQTIFPQMSTQKRNDDGKDVDKEVVKEDQSYDSSSAVPGEGTHSALLPVSDGKAEILQDLNPSNKRKSNSDGESISKRKKRHSDSDFKQLEKVGTDGNSSAIPQILGNLPVSSSSGRLSRSSSKGGDGTFKLPLPPFWNKHKK